MRGGSPPNLTSASDIARRCYFTAASRRRNHKLLVNDASSTPSSPPPRRRRADIEHSNRNDGRNHSQRKTAQPSGSDCTRGGSALLGRKRRPATVTAPLRKEKPELHLLYVSRGSREASVLGTAVPRRATCRAGPATQPNNNNGTHAFCSSSHPFLKPTYRAIGRPLLGGGRGIFPNL